MVGRRERLQKKIVIVYVLCVVYVSNVVYQNRLFASNEKVAKGALVPVTEIEIEKAKEITRTFSPKISLELNKLGSDRIWKELLIHGAKLVESRSKDMNVKPMTAIEVGTHSLFQCFKAAEYGFETHCVEPSPTSFARCLNTLGRKRKQDAKSAQRVHLYNMAAGETSEGTVEFLGSGGTGDHVGDFDMWNMVENNGHVDSEKIPPNKRSKKVNVKNVKIDDIIDNQVSPTTVEENEERETPKIDDVFLLKVDTQGFEPSVFSGLDKSINEKRIKFILFEYWPKGMDLLALAKSEATKCQVTARIMEKLANAGYSLYMLSPESHPTAPIAARKYMKKNADQTPTNSFRANCMWFYNIEKDFPDESGEYKMGYWADVLAVAPDSSIPKHLFSL